MGSTVSCSALPDVPDKIELDACRKLLGDVFDIDTFNQNKSKKIGANFIYKTKLIELINTTDCYLSFCWGRDSLQRENHERVGRINELLALNGLNTWFEDERKFNTFADKLERGLAYSACVIVFVTARYMDKIAGKGVRKDQDDNKLEFEFAIEHKTPDNMIIVLMEDSIKDISQWTGEISKFWNHPMIDYSMSLVDIEDDFDKLVSAVNAMKEKKKKEDEQNKLSSRAVKASAEEKNLSNPDGLKVYGVVFSEGVYHGFVLDATNDTVPHGKGNFVYFYGESYEGDWVRGKKHGRGKLKWDDGGVYEGYFVENERQGKGTLKDLSNNFYEGDWSHNKPNGIGKQIFQNGDIYEGSFVEGRMEGKGRYTWAVAKTVYEGTFENNEKSGRGRLTWSDRAVYEGDWGFNSMQGKGTFNWPNGNVYNGQFAKNRFVAGTFYLGTNNNTYMAIFEDMFQLGDGTEVGGTLNCRVYYTTFKSAGGIFKAGKFCNGTFLLTPE